MMGSGIPRFLSHFHGGLKLSGNKAESTNAPIMHGILPNELVLPVHQHIGDTGELLVKIGDSVLKGQPLTHADTYVSAPIHAPTSGTIKDIREHPIPHPSSLNSLCIILESDGKDEWMELKAIENFRQLSATEIRNHLRQSGIVGLGGAAFPTAVKLNHGPDKEIETLIINGAECEPSITCDDMLMREHADEIISGIEIILHALNAKQCVIAVENNKPEAIESLHHALEQSSLANIKLVTVPTLYPTGGEKQLIKVITGKEVPNNGLPADIGLIMQNVGTVAAIHRAIHLGQPLISRIVTVTGKGVRQPQNIHTLIGTPMNTLIEQSGGYTDRADRLVMGGPMMGFALSTDNLPIIKGANCLLVETEDEHDTEPTMPCIRCGECARVCPANLLPQQLYWHASSKNFELIQDYHLFDCIECGCCAYVCPSHIPLVQYYRFAKTEIWNHERDKIKSDHARVRHDFRQDRLDREKKERDERLRKKKELLAKKKLAEKEKELSQPTTETKTIDPKKAAIEAALSRVNKKKENTNADQKNTVNLTADQQKQIDEADKRRQTNKTD
jgi:H+/Na+-translocating ferredoxin:NAD+ oxidoreductase subunit C